ncbi:MAG: hypothetical protein HC836_11650 [Richelia sp. RM2_1_2]|nr:hypothetical protein [Richelia sp. SM2_1_7]NJM17461.1 hypothetical protein [Richelia sp. SM1_7_0]NJN06522.1 hypothetical protein [Richelia sp. RM1_1_1]NJO26269.1 hypothetical protein [Richelia sp. SL_2_1]NJO58962.1 hypothetical protein [Richelia sp. RM2_1_2]NJS15899.1 hypothetical protein [Nostocaceae cyanobacterium CSU_2_110]
MTSFSRSTIRRLKKIPQTHSVWEGDRRPFSSSVRGEDSSQPNECIIWVDAQEGIVRGMDVVNYQAGPEAIVRTLMRAIESPHSPAKPARPQRIVVQDREIQFYLRGVLQDIDIVIDRLPELPLIDELFRGFSEVIENQIPDLPPQYADLLINKAFAIWKLAPWEFLEEQQIVSIEINQWDIGTLHASVMGMLGMEYGVLLYRSEESLKYFRATVLKEDSSQEYLEEAFLKQDCLFLTFEHASETDEREDMFMDLGDFPLSEISPTFGNIHPLEGVRSILYEEEAKVALVALEALYRFIRDQRSSLSNGLFPSLSHRYRISLPENTELTKSISVTVATQTQLTNELEEMSNFDDDDDEETIVPNAPGFRSLRDDLIPQNSFLSLSVIPWEMLAHLQNASKYYQVGEVTQAGDGLPVIVIQTSRPKAKTVIESIENHGGLKAICFNPGTDPFSDRHYDLGLLQTQNKDLFLFGEFEDDDPSHVEARRKWNQRCQNTQGYCGLIIAKGLTGASRGNPQLPDMMALFEARYLSPKELGIGTFKLMPQL